MRVLLLHALPFDGRMWDREVEWLGPRAVAPTLYDAGDSLQQWAATAADVMGSEPFIAVGCSVGGSCALEVAALVPDQVAGLVLIGAKAGVRPEPAVRDGALATLASGGMEAAWPEYWDPLLGGAVDPGVRATARSRAIDMDPKLIANGITALHDRRPLDTFAAAWTKPLIGISGDHDATPPWSTVQQLATGPARRFHLVEGCGHYVNLERPAEFRTVLQGELDRIEHSPLN